ncbi:transmembrane protein, putative (macronuclear) [Tetrahymena thermophila SB210]|uniref:Transmembrane protein, putative n=1 Tax=Tetrahymena thermophila (strain SB210) TaxID=312017 RepID=W7XIV8_TETTS|nr:transmembrane protein, putative [Tetrahymena thermophila SB210]EWS73644.1 transmembrane protein, putative [Tetrahymena thermophila SB210]|eukprot:XP_012653822.1 transmembrane protein, putative [Tetrahymena thermophila SB210]
MRICGFLYQLRSSEIVYQSIPFSLLYLILTLFSSFDFCLFVCYLLFSRKTKYLIFFSILNFFSSEHSNFIKIQMCSQQTIKQTIIKDKQINQQRNNKNFPFPYLLLTLFIHLIMYYHLYLCINIYINIYVFFFYSYFNSFFNIFQIKITLFV